jgi:hypothetical protein
MPSEISEWVSKIEHTCTAWMNTVTDPDHMAAVEIIREILASDDDDWKASESGLSLSPTHRETSLTRLLHSWRRSSARQTPPRRQYYQEGHCLDGRPRYQ